MGKLKWTCCGWESGGKYGSFKHKEITKSNPDYHVGITMYASGETDKGLEFDRNKIAYFTVIAEIVEV
jgi:hypothetical protein